MTETMTTSGFASPGYLWLLLAVPILFFFDLHKNRLVRLPIPTAKLLDDKTISARQALEFVPPLLKATALALIVFSLARPQHGHHFTEVTSQGVDIMLVLDTSGSMRALDLTLDGREAERLDVVKAVVKDFISGREFDRIGMVVFGSQAYTQCPLTLDDEVLKNYLDIIEIGIAGENTAIGNGIATAVKRLQGSKAKSRVIILLTDGRSNSGEVSPMIAAELAAKAGIKVYTISVGTKGNVPVYEKTLLGRRKLYLKLDVDDETLKDIAAVTGGRFFEAQSTAMLKTVYEEIDTLEKSQITRKDFSEYDEQYLALLWPALVLLVTQWGLRESIFLRIP